VLALVAFLTCLWHHKPPYLCWHLLVAAAAVRCVVYTDV